MKLGVYLSLLQDKSLDEALSYLERLAIDTVEIKMETVHADPKTLLDDEAQLRQFTETLSQHGVTISALSCHGNPVHPDAARAEHDDAKIRNTILLAERLGIDTINAFSGCPGDHAGAVHPNWVTCPWPTEFADVLKWQWEEVLLPYWERTVPFARQHGVTKIAIEMHPGFCVYNPETLFRLRDACGPEIGVNFDPSHLFWQQIDPIKALLALKDCVYHVHAKDTSINASVCPINGVLDTKPYTDEINRSWIFRTVGYGQDQAFWKDFVSTLRLIGYDGALSIEHEDSLMSRDEGLHKAVGFLKNLIIHEPPAEPWWT